MVALSDMYRLRLADGSPSPDCLAPILHRIAAVAFAGDAASRGLLAEIDASVSRLPAGQPLQPVLSSVCHILRRRMAPHVAGVLAATPGTSLTSQELQRLRFFEEDLSFVADNAGDPI